MAELLNLEAMRDDYKMKGPFAKVEIEFEASVADDLVKMEGHSKISRNELVNTALKRFITSHKDFLPPVKHTQHLHRTKR